MAENINDKYHYLSQNKDFGLVFMHYSESKLLDFERAVKEYVESGYSEKNFEEQAEYGFSDVLNWYNGDITTEALFDLVEEEWHKIPDKSVEITDELRKEVYDYCDACGTGIEYDENGNRTVSDAAIESFLEPEVIAKTMYILEERRNGHHIDLIDYDEWVAVSEALHLPDITFDDAISINHLLWEKYDVTPLEIENMITTANKLPEGFEITNDLRAEAAKLCEAWGADMTAEDLFTPESVHQALYILEERRNGNNDISHLDFEEWVATSKLLGMNDLTLTDAQTINRILFENYSVSPVELVPTTAVPEPEKAKKSPSVERD